MNKKIVKAVKMHTFFVCAYKSQDIQENCARLQNLEMETFRKSKYLSEHFYTFTNVMRLPVFTLINSSFYIYFF